MPYSKADVAALERLRDVHHAHLAVNRYPGEVWTTRDGARRVSEDGKEALQPNWLQRPFPGDIQAAVDENRSFGLKPSSLSLVAFDIDGGTADFDFHTFNVPSLTPGRRHHYATVPTVNPDHTKCWFATEHAWGEMIHVTAKLNLWYPSQFLHAYEEQLGGNAYVGWDELPAKWKWSRGVQAYVKAKLDDLEAAPEGTRRNTLRDTALVVFSRVKANQYPGALAWQELRKAAASTGLDADEIETTLQDAEAAAEPWKPSGGNTETLQYGDVTDPRLYFDVRRDAYIWQDKPLDNNRRMGTFLNALTERTGKTTTLQRLRNELLPRVGEALERDPFIDYLESLPPWNPAEERLYGLLGRLGANTNDELVQWAGRAIFGVAVARAYQPGYPIKETVVLRGAQRIGKTPFLRFMPPTDRQFDWFGSIGAMDEFDSRRLLESVQGRVICELEECEGMSNPKCLERVKRFLSSSDDGGVRFSHRQDPESRPRRVVVVGTTNAQTPLPADTGSSRFVVIECKPPDDHDTDTMLADLHRDRDQLWAEALYRWNAKEPLRLPPELWEQQETANRTYMNTDDALEAGLAEISGEDDWMPLRDVATNIDPDINIRNNHALKRIRETAAQLGYRVGRPIRDKGWHIWIPRREDDTPPIKLPF